MMNREQLIAEVKGEYARISASETHQHQIQSTTEISPDAYYEKLLNKALTEIDKGTFDSFSSGQEIVNAIANDKDWLSGWR